MKFVYLPNGTAILSDTQHQMYLKMKSYFEEQKTEVLFSNKIRKRLDIGSTNFNYLLIILTENGLIERPERGVIKLNKLNN